MKKFFLFAAAAMLALVGCEKQNQSSLDFDQVKNSAKISGTLVYLADKAGAATVETPVAGQRIYFLVGADKYAENAGGNQQFEATTKEDGSFEIVVPTGMKAIKGNLKTDVIVLGEAPNRIFLQETDKEITLNANDAKVEKRVADIDAVLTACQGTGILKGKVQYNAGIVEKGGAKEQGLVAAPAGVKINIAVEYEGGIRNLIAETQSDGSYSYSVPVPAAKELTATLTVAQFAGKFTKEFNNQLVSYDALFAAAPVPTTAKDGDTKINDIVAAEVDGSRVEPTSKTTKIKVKGEMFVQAEVFKYGTGDESNKIKGDPKKGTKAYTPELNGGAFELILTHTSGASIIYNLKVNEEGKFETEVAIYDSWDFNDVGITTRVKKFVNKEYYQHYYKKNYKNTPSTSKAESDWGAYSVQHVWQDWADKANPNNQYGSQPCEGIFEAAEQATPITYDGYFAAKVDNTLKFTMSADAKAALYGIGTEEIDKMKDKDGAGPFTIYEGGIDTY